MRIVSAVALAVLLGPSPAEETHLLVVTGLGGEAKHSEAFHEWASSLVDAAEKSFGLPAQSVVYLAEKPEKDPSRIDGPSTREAVTKALEEMARRARPGDQVVIVLIGHGSAQAGEARFNVPGPDLTAADLARALRGFAAQRVAVVNTASASGDFARALCGKDRVVVTATKSGLERNETVFGKHFVAAFTGEGADADKDGRVSLLEAFEYARREVARFYEQENRLQTEHALLEDDGDGVGSDKPAPGSGEGSLASRIFLAGRPSARAGAAGSDPRVAALEKERQQIEERLEALKARKKGMDPERYQEELETLLLELARKSQAIRELEKPKL